MSAKKSWRLEVNRKYEHCRAKTIQNMILITNKIKNTRISWTFENHEHYFLEIALITLDNIIGWPVLFGYSSAQLSQRTKVCNATTNLSRFSVWMSWRGDNECIPGYILVTSLFGFVSHGDTIDFMIQLYWIMPYTHVRNMRNNMFFLHIS